MGTRGHEAYIGHSVTQGIRRETLFSNVVVQVVGSEKPNSEQARDTGLAYFTHICGFSLIVFCTVIVSNALRVKRHGTAPPHFHAVTEYPTYYRVRMPTPLHAMRGVRM